MVDGDNLSLILSRLNRVLELEPKLVFFMAGINDLCISIPLDEVFENYYWIIQNLRRRNIAVVIQSTFSCSVSVCGDRNLMVEELNMRLRDYAVSEQLVYVDINNVIADEGGLRTEVTYDGIHLNGLGYRLWVEVLTPVISELADD